MLTGLATKFLPGTLMQIVISMLVCFVHILAMSIVQPMGGSARKGSQHAWLSNFYAIFVNSIVFVTLLQALLLKLDSGFVSVGVHSEGYSPELIQTSLLVTTGSVVVVASVLVLHTMGVWSNVKHCVRKKLGRAQKNNSIQSLKQGRVQSIINKNKEWSSRNWNLVRSHSKHVAGMSLKEQAVATAAEKLEEQQTASASNERAHSVMLAREQTAFEKQLQVAKQLEVDLQASAIQIEKAAAQTEQRLQEQQASAEQAEQCLQEQRELVERLQAKGRSFEEEMQSRDEGHVNALAEKVSETDTQLKQKEEQHRKALILALGEKDAGTATLLADARSKLEETEFKLEAAHKKRRQTDAYVADLENKLDEAEAVRQSSNQDSAQEYGSSQGDGVLNLKKANNWAEDFWGRDTEAVEPIRRRILEQKTSAGGAGQERQGAVSSMQGGLSDLDQYTDEQPDGDLDPGSKMRFVV
jgi:hypothetical protein